MKFRVASLLAILAAIFAAGPLHAQTGGGKKKVVFIAGKPSHAYGAHEHNAGCLLLAKELQAAVPNIACDVHLNGWPTDEHFADGADCIVMYCDGGVGHMVNKHLDQVDALAKKGVGIVCIHYGVEVPKGESGDKFLDWIGGYFEAHWSVNPTWRLRNAELLLGIQSRNSVEWDTGVALSCSWLGCGIIRVGALRT